MTTNKDFWQGKQIPPAISFDSNRRKPTSGKLKQFVQQGTVEHSCDHDHSVSAILTPMDDRGRLEKSIQVTVSSFDGKDISFHHPLPLASRRVFVSIEDEQLGNWEALVELGWCRFNRMGHYTSGGRFVRPAAKTA